jgi:hypothetical protein
MLPNFPQLSSELLAAILGGLIATFGSVVTLITSHLLRNVGKIIVNVSRFDVSLSQPDNMGGVVTANSLVTAKNIHYRFGLDFFNSSDIPKSLRAISIEFKSEKKKGVVSLKANVPRNGDFTNRPIYESRSEELTIINLPAKEIIHLDLSGNIIKEEIQFLQGKVDFFFKGMSPNGKTFRKKLITNEF